MFHVRLCTLAPVSISFSNRDLVLDLIVTHILPKWANPKERHSTFASLGYTPVLRWRFRQIRSWIAEMSGLNWDDAGRLLQYFLHREHLWYIMTSLLGKWRNFFHPHTPHSFPLLCLQEPKKSVPSSCAHLRGILVLPVFTVELLLQHRGSLNVSESWSLPYF